VDYATRSSPEDERATVSQSFRDIIKLEEPIEKDQERKRNALIFVLDQTKSLGDGSEHGASRDLSIFRSESDLIFKYRNRGLLQPSLLPPSDTMAG
jgi:hypothetical protein